MSQVTVVCPTCRQAMACAEQHRGRNVKCPQCGAIVAVPAAGSPAVPSRTPPSPSITARASAGNVPNRKKMSPLTLATIIAVGLGALFVLGLVAFVLEGKSAKAPDAAPLVGQWERNGYVQTFMGERYYTSTLQINPGGRYVYKRNIHDWIGPPREEAGSFTIKGDSFVLTSDEKEYTLRVEGEELLMTRMGEKDFMSFQKVIAPPRPVEGKEFK